MFFVGDGTRRQRGRVKGNNDFNWGLKTLILLQLNRHHVMVNSPRRGTALRNLLAGFVNLPPRGDVF